MKKIYFPTIIIMALVAITIVALIITLSLLKLKKPEFVSANEKLEEVDSRSNYSEVDQKGIPMPLDWEIESLSGEKILISEKFKGKTLFVNIWATWCGPCVIEMPSIEKLYEQFKDQVGFICVSEESLKKIKRFVKKKEINMPLYRLSGRLPKEFESPGIPTTFIISKEGRLAFKYAGAADWSDPVVVDFLNQLIDESKEEKKPLTKQYYKNKKLYEEFICKAATAGMNGHNPNISKITKRKNDILTVSYVRKADDKLFNYECRIENNQVRIREPSLNIKEWNKNIKVYWEISKDSKFIIIKEEYFDGSIDTETFAIEDFNK